MRVWLSQVERKFVLPLLGRKHLAYYSCDLKKISPDGRRERWRTRSPIHWNGEGRYERTHEPEFSPAGIGSRQSVPVATAVCPGQTAHGQGTGGDDGRADTNLPSTTSPAPTVADKGDANGRIDGEWNSETATVESAKFWRAVRATNFAAGPTDMGVTGYYPQNVEGGRVAIKIKGEVLVKEEVNILEKKKTMTTSDN